jgi:hypothetical protein
LPPNKELKEFLLGNGSRALKVLAILFHLPQPTSVSQIKSLGVECGLPEIKKWNVSQVLISARGRVIFVKGGWELTSDGMKDVQAAGLGTKRAEPLFAISSELRTHISKLEDDNLRAFLLETVDALDQGLFRAAIVLSWVAAIYILQGSVVRKHLPAFNARAAAIDANWKPAKTREQLGRLRESAFLRGWPKKKVSDLSGL